MIGIEFKQVISNKRKKGHWGGKGRTVENGLTI